MAHLHDLPEDVVLLILHELQQPCLFSIHPPQTEHLSKFALASKPLLHLTRKILYSEFWSPLCRQTWKIRAFLCAVIVNPWLASHVQLLDLRFWRAWDRESDEWDESLDDDRYDIHRRYTPARTSRSRTLFRKAIHQLALTDKRGWRKAVMKDVDEVYVALLILLCPNVTHLDLSAPCNPVFIDKALDHATMIRPARSMDPPLQNLKHMRYSCRGNVSYIDFSHVVPFFNLPSVEDAQIDNVLCQGPPPKLLPNFTLKHLCIHSVDADTDVLCSMLSYLKALEIFDYQHQGFIWHHKPGSILRLDDLGSNLSGIATLQALTLRICEVNSGILGSLRECKWLRRLDTSLYYLLDYESIGNATRLVDVLPFSLEELTIGIASEREDTPPSDKYSDMISQVCELVEDKLARFPVLQQIHSRSYSHGTQSEVPRQTAIVDLISACKRHNVVLEGCVGKNSMQQMHDSCDTLIL